MKRIKVCFVSLNVYPFFNKQCKVIHGGAEVQLYFLANKLAEDSRFEVSFMVGNFGQKNVETVGGIRLYKSYNPNIRNNFLTKIYRAIIYSRLFRKIDADVYVVSASDGSIGIFSFLCKLYGKKHLFRTAHQMDVDQSFIKENGVSGKFYKYGLENAAKVITQSKDHQILLKKNHGINATIVRNSFRIRDRKKNKKKYILWVARFTKWKRPELFIKLCKEFPKEQFVMICPPNVDSGKEYSRFIKKAKKIKNLRFIESIAFNGIQKYFDNAKIFVNTSESEGFPNTFIQAGIGKTPIISLNVNPDNFLSKCACGYYCKNNINELSKNLKSLLNNKNRYKTMQKNIFEYTKRNYDLTHNFKKFKNIIMGLKNDFKKI